MSDTTPGLPSADNTTDAEAAGSPSSHERQLIETSAAKEIGGREGPEPTRFGDWEKAGRCIDF